VSVKVTDTAGEFSTTYKTIIVSPLAFSEMTDAQKLIKAIDPIYYDAVIAIIETQKESANTSGYTIGEYDGKAYVQNNPSEFNLLTTTELNASIANAKQEVITNPASYGLVSQVESNTSVAASYESGKQYVLNNLLNFDLVTLTEKLLAVSSAEETGRTYVVANPSEFALVTQAASNTAVATATTTATAAGLILGQSEIINHPADYNLTTLADMNTSVVAATASGVETGKQLVITTPADFGLNVVVPLQVADVNTLPVGWSMMAIPATITDMSIFSSVKVVWYFKDDVWRAYSSNAATTSALAVAGIATLTTLPANSSVWVEK
jgi:hypothetical protein